MDPYTTSHFSNRALLVDLKASVANERTSTAVVISRIAEVDDRKLYLEQGYHNMHAFCVHELHYSEQAAFKRIYAGRAARRFPLILVALADGRLHLSGVVMLSAYLTSGNADELLAAAAHRTKAEIEQLIAERFPRPDLPERLQAIAPSATVLTMAPVQAGLSPGKVEPTTASTVQQTPTGALPLSPGKVEPAIPPSRMKPLAPQRYGVQCTWDQETHDLYHYVYHYVRALMSHEVPTGEMALVLKGALELAAGQPEKRKFAVTDRPGHARPTSSPRHIPAAVKRAVLERDQGRCTFVSGTGRRCTAVWKLEYDHEDPVARGGEATIENIRLRCRGHNQYEAERTFGAGFMEEKRAEARARAGARKQAKARTAAA